MLLVTAFANSVFTELIAATIFVFVVVVSCVMFPISLFTELMADTIFVFASVVSWDKVPIFSSTFCISFAILPDIYLL